MTARDPIFRGIDTAHRLAAEIAGPGHTLACPGVYCEPHDEDDPELAGWSYYVVPSKTDPQRAAIQARDEDGNFLGWV